MEGPGAELCTHRAWSRRLYRDVWGVHTAWGLPNLGLGTAKEHGLGEQGQCGVR